MSHAQQTKPFAIAVPREDYWHVATARQVYVEGARSAQDSMPIVYFRPTEGAVPVPLARNCHVTIESESTLNNQCFLRGIPIVTWKQFYRLIEARP